MIEPGYSRILIKQDCAIEGIEHHAGEELIEADTIIMSDLGPLENNAAFDLLENGHAQYRASQGEQDVPKATNKKASK